MKKILLLFVLGATINLTAQVAESSKSGSLELVITSAPIGIDTSGIVVNNKKKSKNNATVKEENEISKTIILKADLDLMEADKRDYILAHPELYIVE